MLLEDSCTERVQKSLVLRTMLQRFSVHLCLFLWKNRRFQGGIIHPIHTCQWSIQKWPLISWMLWSHDLSHQYNFSSIIISFCLTNLNSVHLKIVKDENLKSMAKSWFGPFIWPTKKRYVRLSSNVGFQSIRNFWVIQFENDVACVHLQWRTLKKRRRRQ